MSDGKILNENKENIMPITHETCVLTEDGTPVVDKIGDIALMNSEGESLVDAINILYDATIKEQIVGALVANGANLTINDSWSTIINAIQKGGGRGELNITSATSLPASGKEEGQLCVVINNPVENYIVTADRTFTESNKIILFNNTGTSNYSVMSKNQQLYFNFYKTSYNNVNVPLYVWTDAHWEQLTYIFIHLLDNGISPTNELGASILTSSTVVYMTDTDGLGYLRFPSTSSYKHLTTTDTMIDFGKYSKVEITARMISGTSGKSIAIGKSNSQQAGLATSSSISTYFTQYTAGQNLTSTWTTYTYDISTWSGTAYLGLWCTSASNQAGFRDIKLYP